MALRDLFRNPFSFFFARSNQEEWVAAYVLREHDGGRDLADILEDPYVRNRVSGQERARLLDRPEVVRALGQDAVEAARRGLGSSGT